jgi:predicted deoxyguanosinetriphosphate triphosphohydrolase
MKMYDEEIVSFAKEQEKIVKKLEYRFHEECDERNRDDLMRDYARVLYSSSFRRLQGKMQLLGIDSSKFNRNRLTHSLEVAQIARSIASELGLENPIVTETASLVHDIGNPPFGHYGETILNTLSEGCGGYEGNAQAFRILRKLEKKHYAYEGLNLTLRNLFAVTKYFETREQAKAKKSNKFIYDEDFYFLTKELSRKNISIKKSIDAQIMDLADEIAYAAHDLEDALSFGFISLGEIVHEFKISPSYNSAHETIAEIAKKVQGKAMQANKMATSEEYAIILKKELTSTIVYTLCKDIGVVNNQLDYKIHAKLAEGLKKLLFKAVLRKKDIQLYEKKGEKVIRGLFEVYSDSSYNKNNMLLPPELRNLKDCKTRLVIDHISGMMDSFACQEYEKYFGKGSLDKIYPIKSIQ